MDKFSREHLIDCCVLTSQSIDSANQNEGNFSDASLERLHSFIVKCVMSRSDAVDLQSP